MRIGFSGHRDCFTDVAELERIRHQYPGAVWVHGGARDGFDLQVHAYIEMYNLPYDVIRPDYKLWPPTDAPLERNKVIVDSVERLFICYDGRKRGGTFQTKNYAESKGVPVKQLPVVRKKLKREKATT